MLVDHAGVALYHSQRIGWVLYRVMRITGRLAFPIFCFQLIEGARYTKKKWWYLLRLVILAVISEAFFDRTLFGSFWDPGHQNVFFTLALGLLSVFVLQWAIARPKKKWAVTIPLFLAALAALSLLAELVLHTDYGAAGVLQIGLMGILLLPFDGLRKRGFPDWLIRVLGCIPGILVCAAICGGSEWFAFAALLPIALYNGQKGYSSKVLQYGLYFFYPVHLILLSLLLIF